MAHPAQRRFARTTALGADDPGDMERSKVAAIRRGDRARTVAYRKGRDAGTQSARRHRGAAFRRASVPEIYDPADERHPGEHGAYHQGVDDALRDERRAAVGGAAKSVSFDGVDDGAGFLLGLIGYALFLAYLRGGPAGVKGWLRAKFLNEPAAASKATPSVPGSPALPLPGLGGTYGAQSLGGIVLPGTPWSPQPVPTTPIVPTVPVGPG